ncbi:MAG TPA: M56 family metallopeptidase [Candidatus Polarisedimenticolaceae bacterium]|nr:M56 family metallopeptidase [Candidatus Polarisedimenticolaceae bacterium]
MNAHAWLAAGSAWVWPRVVHHLWEGTLLALVVLLAALALRRAPARARHRLWLLLAVKLAVPSFLLTAALAWLSRTSPLSLETGPSMATVGGWMTVARVPDLVVPSGGHSEILCIASLIWTAGFLCTAGGLARRQVALARLLARARPLESGPAHEALARLGRSRPTPRVRLLASEEAEHLGSAGILHPTIVIPDALTRVLEPAELDTILQHELAHVRRRDPLVHAVQAALSCVLWFFPVVWLLDRRLAVERERACDEEVLRSGGSPQVYLLALAKACRASLGAPVPGMVTATAALRARIAGLRRPANPRSAGQHASCVLVTLACVTLSLAGMEQTHWRPVTIDRSPQPVRMTAARARIAAAGSEEIVHPPEIRLENGTGRAVTGILLGFGDGSTWRDAVDLDLSLPPHGTTILQPDWRTWHNTRPAGTAAPLHARIDGVRFGPGPVPVAAPAGEGVPARFANPNGAPLNVRSARAFSIPGAPSQVEVALENTTRRRITLVKLRFKSDAPGHAVTARAVELPPGCELLFRSNPIVPGSPEHMTVQVVGVGFEDGGHWGLLDSRIESRWPRVELPEERP